MGKIKCKSKVAILMATYNGERYLKNQIDSIISQDNSDWSLYIQDDGSIDSTVEIIKSYSDNRINLIDVGLTRQGACMNFMTLLNMIDAEYYMFCDQDDVWLPNKIELLLDKISSIELEVLDKPILVYSDKTRVDENLNIMIEREYKRVNISDDEITHILKERNTLDMILLRATAAGCTMLFNHKAKSVSFPFVNLRYQDSIIMLSVIKNDGIIEAILEPTILYRVHSSNTVGCVGDVAISNKLRNFRASIKANINAWMLWKIYGGGGIFRFLKAKYRLLKTRYI